MFQPFLLAAFVLLLSLCSVTAHGNQPLPLESFAKDAEYQDIKLSPDGKHIAATAPQGNETILVVINREQMKIVRTYRFNENEHVRSFYWANNERLIYTRWIKKAGDERGIHYGQIYAGNVNGKKRAIIFGYQGGKYGDGSKIRGNQQPERASGKILHLLPDSPRHILIAASNWDNDVDASMRIIRLNIYSARKKEITRTPFGNMNVITNGKGELVAATGTDRKGKERTFLFRNKQWQEVKKDQPLYGYWPQYSNENGDKLYMTSYDEGGPNALYQYDINSKEIVKRLSHPVADIYDVINDPSTGSLIGAKVMSGFMEYQYLDQQHWYSTLHRSLVATFASNDISVTSMTEDKNVMIVRMASDKSPNTYYIYDRKTNKLSYLLSAKSWINSKQMASRHPVRFKARDGVTLHGYLTLPNSASKDKKAPLVTLVHGGPFGVKDKWMFDSEAQMLANNGYAVIQVNYRGSSGYGLNYRKSAYQKMGTLIQQDIIDGTHYALSQPEVDSEKVCIMGWSFGGYSAVMAPIVEPGLFKCSIAASGDYDLVLQEQEADYRRVDSAAAKAERYYGSDPAMLKAQSPMTHIDKFNIPVLIVHGGKDERVPPEHAKKLKAALEQANKPYEWLFKKYENHGFYKQENRVEFYQRTLKFLERYL